MELIPILSLIILVATISTFMLAVGAYILYKVRERKGVGAQAPQPSAIPAELVTPAPLTAPQTAFEKQGRRTFEVMQPQQEFGYDYQRQQQYQHDEMKGPELRPTFVGSTSSENRYQRPQQEVNRYTDSQRLSDKKKFMRYTNEGYVEPTKQEKKQEDNLKWR
jgi:hypothetical protein